MMSKDLNGLLSSWLNSQNSYWSQLGTGYESSCVCCDARATALKKPLPKKALCGTCAAALKGKLPPTTK